MILPRPGQYGQRRLGTSPATAPAATAPAGAYAHAESAFAEVYARGAQLTQARDGNRETQKIPPPGRDGILITDHWRLDRVPISGAKEN
ncbi:hypothetical protein GCM10010508_44450 [Streptomyces naganishii JCM 4654]|uniref:Uncharacterized protein n=1 Tax=Streptomyces naganishii JCM 4654 TaxID=1306179 RepID=A0A918Y751_9ACTN|nr:hypothetical protein GCM10010508_44450 [Streptomyces naganishii JCM 4654]